MPIFFFYMSYLQGSTSTCHHCPKLTEFLRQIGFPHTPTREKSCQQLGRHRQTQNGSLEPPVMVTLHPSSCTCCSWHQACTGCCSRCRSPSARTLLKLQAHSAALKLHNCFSNLMGRVNRGTVVQKKVFPSLQMLLGLSPCAKGRGHGEGHRVEQYHAASNTSNTSLWFLHHSHSSNM